MKTTHNSFAGLAVLGLLLGGSACRYDEGLIIENMRGTVVIPREAATRVLPGDTNPTTDVRNIGPVYVGLYSGVEAAGVLAPYPHPNVGPQYQEDVPGDTYPYGGTTIGDLRYACFEELVCSVSSGRFTDFDDLVSWFNDSLGRPITDVFGNQVSNGDYFRQVCYEVLNVTSDDEVRITAFDRNEDEKIDAADLDFVENDDGDFVGTFNLIQQDFAWNQEQEDCEPGLDCDGFRAWAWMDTPDPVTAAFTTCDPTEGFRDQEYVSQFFSGIAPPDTLNQPAKYISEGDYTVSEAFVWSNIYDEPELRLDFKVEL